MQMLRGVMTRMNRRALFMPLAAVGLALTLSLSGCGDDDDDTCGYLFVDVPTVDECEDLAAELDCATFAFDADDDECSVGGCLLCEDIDTDYDGDFDFDGDQDLDGD